ncbi:lysophospholipid acyltransferase family protein [Dietzia sp. CH92]|uniref:lysophospholipid acyltransferase family protein n=1 Tax=Dietzia sp. CH92 TaxID=3051823 RepID=UPI0028D58B08|nr:lysophospholipid acyltransferase family protein [Dietzia sp. CH92]
MGASGEARARRRRPEVTVANWEAVYDFYGPRRRRNWFTYPLLTLVDAIYRPRLRIAPETVAELHRLHDAGVGIIVAANHPSAHDPTVLAAAVFDERVRFLAEGTGLTKDPIFRGPLRPIFEYTGTVPVFRAKNYQGTASEIHEAAAARLIEVCVERLVDGGVVLTFVEGTNSSADDLRTLRLESVKKGVGMMVADARRAGAGVAVLPLGLAYHGREHAGLPPRRAVVAAGRPLLWESGPPPTVDEVRRAVRDGIDDALTAAWG